MWAARRQVGSWYGVAICQYWAELVPTVSRRVKTSLMFLCIFQILYISFVKYILPLRGMNFRRCLSYVRNEYRQGPGGHGWPHHRTLGMTKQKPDAHLDTDRVRISFWDHATSLGRGSVQ